MSKYFLFIFVFIVSLSAKAQSISDKLNLAWQHFMADAQLQYSTAGICVMDAQSGKIIFGRNENIGMAPASTQKIFTTVAAFEALGKDFRYQTPVGYTGYLKGKALIGDIAIGGSGDPTLGSWRYENSKPKKIFKQIGDAFKQLGVDTIRGDIVELENAFDINPVPQDWMWGDMGNYYGTGHWALNWNENQYDITLTSTKTGDNVKIKKNILEETYWENSLWNKLVSGEENTGDESIIFAAPFSSEKLMQGKISANKSNFVVSGSNSFADKTALDYILKGLAENKLFIQGYRIANSSALYDSTLVHHALNQIKVITTIQSPSLDSIVYWFLRKSINLYGEALLRTIGLEKEDFGSTENGLKWVDSFYTANHIDIRSRHMRDGSGLSPTNRVTPMALVQALQLAKTKSWFPYFYDALPIYNGMKLKSGTIHRTKCYAGYHTGKDGKQFIVSLMVNNFNGETSLLVEKMFKVLDILK